MVVCLFWIPAVALAFDQSEPKASPPAGLVVDFGAAGFPSVAALLELNEGVDWAVGRELVEENDEIGPMDGVCWVWTEVK